MVKINSYSQKSYSYSKNRIKEGSTADYIGIMGIHASDPHRVLDVIPTVTKLITILATTEIAVTGISDTACDFLSAFQCLLNVKRILL